MGCSGAVVVLGGTPVGRAVEIQTGCKSRPTMPPVPLRSLSIMRLATLNIRRDVVPRASARLTDSQVLLP